MRAILYGKLTFSTVERRVLLLPGCHCNNTDAGLGGAHNVHVQRVRWRCNSTETNSKVCCCGEVALCFAPVGVLVLMCTAWESVRFCSLCERMYL